MKLNRIMLVATAAVLVVGSAAMVGCNRAADEDVDAMVGTEQAVEQGDSLDEGMTQNASTTTDVGVESYAHGGGSHGGGSHGGGSHAGASHGGGAHGAGHAAGAHGGHGFEHGGFGHGGYGHGYGYGRGGYGHGWGGGGRWGRWGGGRYVDGRWVGGPYYGWCNDSYYSCERAWW